MKAMRWTGVLLLAVILTACASAGGGGRAAVTQTVGTAARGDLDSTLRMVLSRNQYVLERETLETNMTYETRWRLRQPFDDERALGATQAESRIIVRARPRSREGNNYTVTMTVENRIRTGDAEWVQVPATEQFSAYARELTSELERELATGIRVR